MLKILQHDKIWGDNPPLLILGGLVPVTLVIYAHDCTVRCGIHNLDLRYNANAASSKRNDFTTTEYRPPTLYTGRLASHHASAIVIVAHEYLNYVESPRNFAYMLAADDRTVCSSKPAITAAADRRI